MQSPHKNKVLVIDDSRVIRNMVKDMLPPTNFEVLEAQDGLSGLEMVKEHHPWMILLDFILPKMSGYDVYQNLQTSRDLATIPLVIMSGRKQEVTDKIPEPIDDHYLAFLEKPFEQRNLVEAIKKALELGKQKSQKLEAAAQVSAPVDAGAGGAEVDQALFARLASLEEKVTLLEEENKKIKVLEQQIVTQHKQIQQLVAFVKQKLS